jgi:hypothetical protein
MENMLIEKWAPLLNEQIGDNGAVQTSKQSAAAVMLENQARYILEETTNVTGGVDKWDPILIGMVRRAIPKLLGMELCSVQPMTGPSGLIFAMRSRYNTQAGAEAIRETNGASGTAVVQNNDIFGGDFGGATKLNYTEGLLAAASEALGTGATPFKEMAFTIEKYSVIAGSRALKASWSTELEQDLRAVHGMSAEEEMVNMLSNEIAQDMNREVLRKMYFMAKLGAATYTTTAGIFDLNTDSNGRWAVEKFKGLLMQIEIESNAIASETLRGKGNFIVTTPNVASALAMTGLLENITANNGTNGSLIVDTTLATYAGTIMGRMAVYVDPWAYDISNHVDFVLVGYKGNGIGDSGMIYSPYTPVELSKVVNTDSFQPALAMKTRYALSQAPLENGATAITTASYRSNPFYRIFKIVNLM